MTKETLAEKLKEVRQDTEYKGELTGYAVASIEEGRSSYPVSNLIAYCQGIGVQFIMTDMATDESFDVDEIMEVHNTIALLMDRYEIDDKLVYRKTAVHYTAPKNGKAPLSINTLLAVCSVLHCRLDFVKK